MISISDIPPKSLMPQQGKQMMFASCQADGAIFGGAAGCGKSVLLLMEASRGTSDPYYSGIIFRRKTTEITTPGGLWDTAQVVYAGMGATFNKNDLSVTFPIGSRIKFAHLEHEKNIYDHQGGQYAFIGFDEIITFTKRQIFFILTRNRPPMNCKVTPYWRATCNPDVDHYVREWIDWWIDDETGYPIEDRCGVVRHYTVINDEISWVTKDWRDEDGLPPKSFTFINALMGDNAFLDPNYRSNIRAQDRVTRERLERGNWNISYKGSMFDARWFEIVDSVPPEAKRAVRYWDFACTPKNEEEAGDPDWTAGALVYEYNGVYYISDMEHMRDTPAKVENRVQLHAGIDGREVAVVWEEEKGSSGKFVSDNFVRNVLKGYVAIPDPVSGDKIERAKPVSALAERGCIKLVRGAWNRAFLAEAGSFPLNKKDQVDALSGAIKYLSGKDRVLHAYNPHKHIKDIVVSPEEFAKYTPEEIQIFLSIWQDNAGGISAGCYAWAAKSKKLRVYGEMYDPTPVPVGVSAKISKMLMVPMTKKVGYVTLTKSVCNAEFAGIGKDSVRKVLSKYGVKATISRTYDEAGAIAALNQLFDEGSVSVRRTGCEQTDIAIRTWTIEDGKPGKAQGLVKALLLVAWELKETRESEHKADLNPYSQKKARVRQSVRSGGLDGGVVKPGEKSMDDYLLK